MTHEEYWSWDNRHLRVDIKRTGINYLNFSKMQVEQLQESIRIILTQISGYDSSSARYSKIDSERLSVLYAALQSAEFYLKEKQSEHT